MEHIQDNVSQVIATLVPASVINNIACFVFYDNHPRDNKNIDITICTIFGEILEYYQRDLISSVKLDTTHRPSEIKIFRNTNCDLFYIVSASDDLLILSRSEVLKNFNKVSNVERFDIADLTCSGDSLLRVVCKDDAVPLLFDEKFENLKSNIDVSYNKEDQSLPIITHLMRKLTEARYNVKHNKKTYTDVLKIHQKVEYEAFMINCPGVTEVTHESGSKEIASALNINTQTPWIKVCNKEIVIVFNIFNQNQKPLEDIHILLHTENKSIEYTTKIFEESLISPYWKEKSDQVVTPNTKSALVLVIKLEELKHTITSRIELHGAVFYKRNSKEYLLPIDDVVLISIDTMGQDFDALCSDNMDRNTILAVMATAEKTELILRHIKASTEEDLSIHMFTEHLQFDSVLDTYDIVVHRRSPYHVLHGVMVKWDEKEGRNSYLISVYSRTPSQVLALIHYITDAVPHRTVITTPAHKITAKHKNLSSYNEDVLCATQLLPDYSSYVPSMLNRTKLILDYLDNSMIKMSESKNSVIQNKIGSEIDLFAGGEEMFRNFKEKMREEADKGVQMLVKDVKQVVQSDSDVMFID